LEIAQEKNWPSDWLNDSVKGFLQTEPPYENFISFPGLHIYSVTPEYLLAMKLFSSRHGTTDVIDIEN
jgi:hypothetical protein